jgi:hypothetical protein
MTRCSQKNHHVFLEVKKSDIKHNRTRNNSLGGWHSDNEKSLVYLLFFQAFDEGLPECSKKKSQ